MYQQSNKAKKVQIAESESHMKWNKDSIRLLTNCANPCIAMVSEQIEYNRIAISEIFYIK